MKHSEAVALVCKAIQSKHGTYVAVFKRQVGMFLSPDGSRMIHVGLPGQADVWGWTKSGPFEIEVKLGKDRQSEHQKRWEELCARFNVVYLVCYADRPGEIERCVNGIPRPI